MALIPVSQAVATPVSLRELTTYDRMLHGKVSDRLPDAVQR